MRQYPHCEEPTESGVDTKRAFGEKAREEMRDFVFLTAYLYICFAAVIYFKAAVLQAHGIIFSPFGIAVVKAALCAKFMLMGRIFHLGERFKNLPLIVPTLYRAFLFLLLLVALTFIEEVIVAAIHGRTAMDAISAVAGGTLPQIAATSLIIFLILIPYFAFEALGEVIGNKILKQLFFNSRLSA
jgi:hypothetical protein